MVPTAPRPVALITGAARRVGRAVALALAGSGHDVVLHYHRSKSAAEATADELRQHHAEVWTVSADLADPEAPDHLIGQAVRCAQRLDVLVNNAAGFEKCPLEQLDQRRWDACLQVNLAAAVQLCRHAAPVMRRGGGGCIVNFCDIMTHRPQKDYLAYGVSKAGLDYATRALALELAPDIRVNGVAPGIAVFPETYSEILRQRLIARVPLGRAGTPADMGRAVRFLVESPYVTGQVVSVDGGRGLA